MSEFAPLQKDECKDLEKELVEKGKTIDEAKLDEMDEIWDQIKSQGK